jgi:hypothetical protein
VDGRDSKLGRRFGARGCRIPWESNDLKVWDVRGVESGGLSFGRRCRVRGSVLKYWSEGLGVSDGATTAARSYEGVANPTVSGLFGFCLPGFWTTRWLET